MRMRKPVVLAIGALLLATAPVVELMAASQAVAQAASLQSRMSLALANAKARPGFSRLTKAQQAAILATALRNVVSEALVQGASSNDITDAIHGVVSSGEVDAAIAVEGVALGAAQAATRGATVPPNLVASVQQDSAVQTGIGQNQQVAVASLNAAGQPVTTFTNLSTFLAATTAGTSNNNTGGGGGGTVNIGNSAGSGTTAPPSAFNPCVGVIADYC